MAEEISLINSMKSISKETSNPLERRKLISFLRSFSAALCKKLMASYKRASPVKEAMSPFAFNKAAAEL